MTPPGSHAPKKPLPRFLGTRQGLWDVAVEPPFIPPGPALGPGQKRPHRISLAQLLFQGV